MLSCFAGSCEPICALELLSVEGIIDIAATDLLTETLAGNGTFAMGWLSSVSDLILLLKTDPLSVDNDLLIGGDGDLGFPELANLSSAGKGTFGVISLSANAEGNLDLLCLPEEQLLA